MVKLSLLLGLGQTIFFEGKVMTLEEALNEFIDAITGECRLKTINWYETMLTPMVNFLQPETKMFDITAQMLRQWRLSLSQKGTNIHTLHGYLRAARRFFNWLYQEQMVTENPMNRIRLPKLPDQPPKAINELDLKTLIEVAAKNNPRDLAIILFLADTGCRISGVAQLRIENVIFDERRGKAVVTEKGSKNRLVFFGFATQNAIKALLNGRKEGHIFLSAQGKPLTAWGIYLVLKRLAEQGNITGRWNPHAFRHRYARHLLQNGATLDQVSDMMGHSSVLVTQQFYARWLPDELQKVHEKSSPVDNCF